MHPLGYEHALWELSAQRKDVLEHCMGPQEVAVAATAVRPHRVLSALKVTEEELLELVRSGVLPPPADWGHGRVAWRWDEIDAAAKRLDAARDALDGNEQALANRRAVAGRSVARTEETAPPAGGGTPIVL